MYRDAVGVAVHGFIDSLFKRPDHILIVDYKSHFIDEQADVRAVAEKFATQLAYYREGVERLWPGMRTETGILLTQKRRLVML